LSRLLTGGSDLVVDVKPRFDGTQDPFKSTSLIADIANAVPTIDLPAQNKLTFRIHVTGEKGRAAMERFIQEDSESLAELVGFKTSAIETQFE
jgi:hypothetical protein